MMKKMLKKTLILVIVLLMPLVQGIIPVFADSNTTANDHGDSNVKITFDIKKNLDQVRYLLKNMTSDSKEMLNISRGYYNTGRSFQSLPNHSRLNDSS
ncbi:MAG: hypothetical protein ACE5J3_11345, partial [Methanosarcinales archaeon]